MTVDLNAKPLTGKTLLLLDGSRKAIEIVNQAHRLGLRVIITDYNPPELSPAKLVADEHYEVSTSEVDSVVALARRKGVSGILAGFSDRWLPTYAEICAAAGLPSYATVDQIRLFTDKKRYKALMAEFGVPTLTSYSVEEATSGRVPDSAFPLIIKPSDGSGSRGISIAKTQEDLQQGLSVALDYSWTQDLVIEPYMPGQEATVYWVFQDGEHHVSLMWNRHMHDFGPDAQYRLPVAYSSPSAILPRYLEETAPRVKEMLRSVGVKNGIMFMQGLVRDGVFYTYDIGYRITPTREYRVIEELCGYNPLAMLLHFAVTGSMGEPGLSTLADPVHDRYGYNVSVLVRPGTIGRYRGLDEVAQIPGVLSVGTSLSEGETLPEEGWGQLRQIAVRVIGTAETPHDIATTMRRIGDLTEIIDGAGGSLVIPDTLPPTDLMERVL